MNGECDCDAVLIVTEKVLKYVKGSRILKMETFAIGIVCVLHGQCSIRYRYRSHLR